MSEQLFGEIASPTVRVGTRTWKTVPVSMAVHGILLAALVVVPLMATGAVPAPQSVLLYVAPPILPPPPPAVARPQPVTPREVPRANPDAAPPVEPSKLNPEPAQPPSLGDTVVPGAPIGPWAGTAGGFGQPVTLPPRPAPPPAPSTEPRRIGGDIKEPAKIFDVRPVYPQIAQQARVAGMVIIEATIGRDGTVTHAKVLRSVPLLDQAALEAVRQWRFTPTLLNGVPVPILLTVTVNFTLR